MLAAIRLRGSTNVNARLKRTLELLNLKKTNSCAILPETSIRQLKNVEAFITYGELDKAVHEQLIKRAGADSKVFNLPPPKRGYKSIKKAFPKGDLGYRGKEINELIKRMI